MSINPNFIYRNLEIYSKNSGLSNFFLEIITFDPNFDKVVLGHLNIYFPDRRRNANSSQKRSVKGITEPHDLKQVTESPTRITDHSESLIDLCFTNRVRR